MASSSQKVPSDPQRRLESKQLPSVRYLGTGLSGYIYETTWLGNRYTRKDFPLGSAKLNGVFEGETKSLLDLDHPNIVKCFGYTIGKSSCSLLLEYLDDGLQSTMEKRIEAQRKKNLVGSNSTSRSRVLDVDEIKRLISRKMEERKAIDVDSSRMSESTVPFEVLEAGDIIFQIATGMEYLHDNGIAHGDLKPNNVLLNSTPDEMIVKVTDFNLIETKKRIKLVSKRSRHFEVLMWKAPECLEKLLGPLTIDSDDPFTNSDTDSDEETDSSDNFKSSKLAMADVYSFGLTCLHILGVELVQPDLSLTQLRKQRMRGFSTEFLASACPEFLGFIIRSSLQPEPSSRPTFSTICELLKTALPSKQLSMQLPRPMTGEGHVRYGENLGKYVVEYRPLRFKWKLWMGTYSYEQDARRAFDCATFYAGQGKGDYHFPDSPELFQKLGPLQRPFSQVSKDTKDKAFNVELKKRAKQIIRQTPVMGVLEKYTDQQKFHNSRSGREAKESDFLNYVEPLPPPWNRDDQISIDGLSHPASSGFSGGLNDFFTVNPTDVLSPPLDWDSDSDFIE